MTTGRRYSKPPITEAVIDLRVEETLADREMERLRDRFKRQFPSIDESRTFTVELGVAGKQQSKLAGFKMTASNGVDLVLINEGTFGTSRFAPYECWESFSSQARDNFEVFTKVVGRKKITRVGVRFINRFDIPNRLISDEPLAKFLRVGVSMPSELSRVIGGFGLVAEGVESETKMPFILRSAVIAPPPLIDHVSIQLDVDAYWDIDIPARIDEMWAGMERLRSAKNAIFEKSITQELRKLFE